MSIVLKAAHARRSRAGKSSLFVALAPAGTRARYWASLARDRGSVYAAPDRDRVDRVDRAGASGAASGCSSVSPVLAGGASAPSSPPVTSAAAAGSVGASSAAGAPPPPKGRGPGRA